MLLLRFNNSIKIIITCYDQHLRMDDQLQPVLAQLELKSTTVAATLSNRR
jgi:hypothetical protein